MGKNKAMDGEDAWIETGGTGNLEEELLEWQERLFRPRGKYRETPPGFRQKEAEEEGLRRLCRIRKEYEERRKPRMCSGYRAPRECFVGRDAYLARIEEIFSRHAGPAVLYGIGGIGKTAIARAYVRRREGAYGAVLFLCCDTDYLRRCRMGRGTSAGGD